MVITEREAEEICITLMRMRDRDGKIPPRSTALSVEFFRHLIEQGTVVIELEKDLGKDNQA
jgi:hypothetical protein